jgi:hypothetical protein
MRPNSIHPWIPTRYYGNLARRPRVGSSNHVPYYRDLFREHGFDQW